MAEFADLEKDPLLDGLDAEQVSIIKKHFDYMLCLSYLKDETSSQHKEDVEAYKYAVGNQIASMIDVFQKRNALKEKGILK